MNADLLRLILFIAGIALVLGIYFWERHKRIDSAVHAIRREQEAQEHHLFDEFEGEPLPESETEPELAQEIEPWPELAPEVEAEEEAESEEIGEPEPEANPLDRFVMSSADEPDDGNLAQELGQLDALVSEEKKSRKRGEQLPFAFAAEEPEEVVVELPPTKIVQIHIKARRGAFAGEEIMPATQALGLKPGEMDIFHCMGQRVPGGREKSLYSMANLVEPGSFPMTAMEGFATPGLVLFLQLPTAGDDLALFNQMLSTAEGLATRLGGELQDETHSVLTRQTIEHIRGEIVELKRRQRLAQKRS